MYLTNYIPKVLKSGFLVLGLALATLQLTACDNALDKLDLSDLADIGDTPSSSSKKQSGKDDSMSSSGKAVTESSSSAEEDTLCLPYSIWCGANGKFSVDPDMKTYEYWSFFSDISNGGGSTFKWPVDDDPAYILESVRQVCEGLCGSYTLSSVGNGTIWQYEPYIGLQINVAGWSNSPDNINGSQEVTTSIEDWGGICVTYTSSEKMTLTIGMGHITDSLINYTNPFVDMPPSAEPITRCYPWAAFYQNVWSTTNITGAGAAKSTSRLKFQVQSRDGISGSFNIISIGDFVRNYNDENLYTNTPGFGAGPSQLPESYWSELCENSMWCGALHENSDVGPWFDYNDDSQSGDSRFIWPVFPGFQDESDYLESVMDECSGICGGLEYGFEYKYPYLGFGFSISPDNVEVDISEQMGLCVAYESTESLQMKLLPNPDMEKAISYNSPYINLPKSAGNSDCYLFDNFRQNPTIASERITIQEVQKHASKISFSFSGVSGRTASFNIRAISWL